VSIIAIITTSILMFVFGETLPKTAGVRFARTFTSLAAVPLYFFFQAIYPARYLFRSFTDRFLGLFGINPDQETPRITDEEVLSLLKLGKEEGVLDLTEETLLQNIFDLGDLQVSDVMTPAQEIFRLPVDTPLPDIIESVKEQGYSRVPIFRSQPDNIIGILNAKDIIRIEHQPDLDIISFLHEPYFIPRQKRIDELLKEFQARHTHLALVVNEFGGIVGLVTMEDILEEIFGEASSEKPEQEELVELGEGTWEALGRMELNTFKERFQHKLQAPGVRTLGGYLLYHFGSMPKIGESISREGFRFTVKEVRRLRIHRILIETEGALREESRQ
jgi:putative hemolysin